MGDAAVFTQGTNVISIGAPGNGYSLSRYGPRSPSIDADGNPDLVTAVADSLIFSTVGGSIDQAVEKVNALERMLENAKRYQSDRSAGSVTTVYWKPEGLSYTLTSEVFGGWVEKPADVFERPDTRSYRMERAVLHFTRRPIWEGPEATLTLTTSPSDNGANNFGALPLVGGDLPARGRIRVTLAGGNSANCKRVLAALRYDGTPANFQHLLKVANMPAGWAITAGTDTAISADANFLSANKARYTPNGARPNENMMVRWVYTGANIADQLGTFVPIVRFRDNHTAANFKLRMRAGFSTSQYGAYSLPDPRMTLYADSAGTTEIGSMDLGIMNVPGAGWDPQIPGSLIYELLVTPATIAGTLDVDYIGLFPLGESRDGHGLAAAEYPAAIASNRAYFDSRWRYDPAYLTDGSDVKQASYSDYPDGAGVLIPAQKAGQRIYFWVTRSRDDLAKHSAATTVNAVVTAIPQYIHAKGMS